MVKKTANNINENISLTLADHTLISVLNSLPIAVIVFKDKKILYANTIALSIFSEDKKIQNEVGIVMN